MKKYLLTAALLAPLAVQAQTATISTTDASVDGVNLSTGSQNAATSGYFTNDGNTLLVIINSSTNPVTPTIRTQRTSVNVQGVGPVSLSDVTASAPAGARSVFGPFPPGRWNTQQGTVGVSMSGVTGVSWTAIRVSQQ